MILVGCGSSEDLSEKPVYKGPTMSLDSVSTALSDSGLVVLRKWAAKEDQYATRDVEWSEGLSLIYYDKNGEESSTFRSNYAFYYADSSLYKGTGNVIVKNVTSGDELNTEELFWNDKTGIFYTDKFVTIRSEDEIHTGEGLTANQDFTEYTILKPTGTITIQERLKTPDYEVN